MRSAPFLRFISFLLFQLSLHPVLAFDCSTTAFTGVLPSNVTVTNASLVPADGQYGDPLDHDFPSVCPLHNLLGSLFERDGRLLVAWILTPKQ